jgi:Tol biopolymer transport system component
LTKPKRSSGPKRDSRRQFVLRDRYACTALILVSLAARIPFLKTFDLVSYDGTYYINQAKALLSGNSASAFPIGYPAFIALLLPIIHDGVRAAQTVSLLAALASLCVFYLLCARFVRRELAMVGAVVLGATPIFIQSSLLTMSESLYLLWLLLGLLLFSHQRFGRSGLSLGLAAITRPEALGVMAVLGLFKIRRRKSLLRLVGCFALVYTLGAAALSLSVGQVELLSKSGNFGLSAHLWQKREAWVDTKLAQQAKKELEERDETSSTFSDYLSRLPKEVLLLNRHLLPVAFLLGLYGLIRRRGFLLAALVPFLVYPAFTPRSEPRFILPYLPVLILYALIAVELLGGKRRESFLCAGLLLAGAVGVWLNYPLLVRTTSTQFEFSRKAAEMLKTKHLIEPGDLVADRKPYFAFYSGARYLEIPIAGYQDTMEFLAHKNARYLMLDKNTIHALRPALRPLLYDAAAINGELRYAQIDLQPGVAILYSKRLSSDPLTLSRLTPEGDREYISPIWSPDGKSLAYRVADPGNRSRVCIRSVDGGSERTILTQKKFLDVLSWSPDGKSLALSVLQNGNVDLALYDLTRDKLTPITSDPANDISPSWSPDGKWIAFSSRRSGSSEIWLKNLQTPELRQLTRDGGNGFPSFSPTGDRLAWTHQSDGIHLLDLKSGETKRLSSPSEVFYRPAWNRDGRCLAVTADGLLNKALYLVDSESGRSLLLTKSYTSTGLPSFNPLSDELAAVIFPEGDSAIWILHGLQAYLDRLYHPIRIETFQRPSDAP